MTEIAAVSAWWDDAACQSVDPDLFFPVSASGPALPDIARARAICESCLIRVRCLDFAMRTGQRDGVWGGLTEQERVALARSRRRSRAADRLVPAG